MNGGPGREHSAKRRTGCSPQTLTREPPSTGCPVSREATEQHRAVGKAQEMGIFPETTIVLMEPHVFASHILPATEQDLLPANMLQCNPPPSP